MLLRVFSNLFYFVLFWFLFTHNTSAAEPNYQELLKDSSFPVTLGVGCSLGYAQSRDALVPSNKFDDPAIANAFAFKVDGAAKSVMAGLLEIGSDVYLTTVILNRSLWKVFRAYPQLGIEFVIRSFDPLSSNHSGLFYGGGINFSLHTNYLQNMGFFPKFAFAIGIFDAPIDAGKKRGSVLEMSHPSNSQKPQFDDTSRPLHRYSSLGYLLRGGVSYKYKLSRLFAISTDFMIEWLLLGAKAGKPVIVNSDTRIATKKVPRNSKFKPKKSKITSLVNFVFQTNLECTFNPSKRRFVRYDKESNKNSIEVGCVTQIRNFSKMTSLDRTIYDKTYKRNQPNIDDQQNNNNNNNKKKKELNFDDNFVAVGIYGLYSYRYNNLFSFLASTELIFYDQMVKKKIDIVGLASKNTSRLALYLGFGTDFNILKFRTLFGYDIFSMDYLGEQQTYAFLARLSIKLGLQIKMFDKLGLGVDIKVRPMQNYAKSKYKTPLIYDSIGFTVSYTI